MLFSQWYHLHASLACQPLLPATAWLRGSCARVAISIPNRGSSTNHKLVCSYSKYRFTSSAAITLQTRGSHRTAAACKLPPQLRSERRVTLIKCHALVDTAKMVVMSSCGDWQVHLRKDDELLSASHSTVPRPP